MISAQRELLHWEGRRWPRGFGGCAFGAAISNKCRRCNGILRILLHTHLAVRDLLCTMVTRVVRTVRTLDAARHSPFEHVRPRLHMALCMRALSLRRVAKVKAELGVGGDQGELPCVL